MAEQEKDRFCLGLTSQRSAYDDTHLMVENGPHMNECVTVVTCFSFRRLHLDSASEHHHLSFRYWIVWKKNMKKAKRKRFNRQEKYTNYYYHRYYYYILLHVTDKKSRKKWSHTATYKRQGRERYAHKSHVCCVVHSSHMAVNPLHTECESVYSNVCWMLVRY